MFRKLMLIACILILATMSVSAQEEPSCEVGDLQTGLRSAVEQWIPLIDSLEITQDAFDLMLGFQTAIATQRTICSGGVYTSEEYSNGIIGPISFGGTLYQATLTSDEYTNVDFVVLEGDCDFVPSIYTGVEGGEETNLFEFDGCMTMLEVDSRSAWTLTFERLR